MPLTAPAKPDIGTITVRPARAEDVPLIFENIAKSELEGKIFVPSEWLQSFVRHVVRALLTRLSISSETDDGEGRA